MCLFNAVVLKSLVLYDKIGNSKRYFPGGSLCICLVLLLWNNIIANFHVIIQCNTIHSVLKMSGVHILESPKHIKQAHAAGIFRYCVIKKNSLNNIYVIILNELYTLKIKFILFLRNI